jgi:hypothetical protein
MNFCNNYINYTDRKVLYKPLRLILIRQVIKIRTLIAKLHEDLQFDHSQEFNAMLEEAENKFTWFDKHDYAL